MKAPNNKQAISSSSHFFQLIKNGLKAGGVTLLISGFIWFLSEQVLRNVVDNGLQTLIGMALSWLLCCLIPPWAVAQGILGVSFYNRSSGNIASPMDGAQIGAASGIFLVLISGISALVTGQAFEEFISGFTIQIILPMAFLSAWGGHTWASSNQKKSAPKSNGT